MLINNTNQTMFFCYVSNVRTTPIYETQNLTSVYYRDNYKKGGNGTHGLMMIEDL